MKNNQYSRRTVSEAEQKAFSDIAKSAPTLSRWVETDADFIIEGEVLTTLWSAKYSWALQELRDNVSVDELKDFFTVVEKVVSTEDAEVSDVWQTGFIESLVNCSDSDKSLLKYVKMLGPKSMEFAEKWGVNWEEEKEDK